MIKVSVIVITYRPGYIDNIVDSLLAQTMPHDQFELVLVDDILPLREREVRDYIQEGFSYQHTLSGAFSEYSAASTAFNTGVAAARGELVFFMADYCYLHPRCLERHWEIYQKYGPNVIISGRLVDAFTVNPGAPTSYPAILSVDVGGQITQHPEWVPPVPIPMVDDIKLPNQGNLISIWQERFRPQWPQIAPDWRLNWTAQKEIAPGLYENLPDNPRWKEISIETFDRFSWWWGGRNDSAPKELILKAGGMTEINQEAHGGSDGLLAASMGALGARYLIDVEAPVMVLPHPFRKKEIRPV